jgi:ATP-binding cassette subfamily B protein/subfamily B ATP-binding cassette protein MsbA
VVEVLEAEVEVADPARPVAVPSGGLRGEVRLQGVTVGYTPGRPVLTDVDLHAQPGQTIALVGRTGAGKSTLASLIPRFFDPWAGHITIDGIDLRDLRLTDLRRNVALVTQEPLLLPTTIADNIAYGRPDAGPDAIEAAARAANAHEFIATLPDGYQTTLGERGATLSGGQRQRLAIARALLKDAPVLVLDEPTAALDAQTEHLLLEALDHLVAHRTTFVIAHRLSTIRNAHQIAVLDHGHITHTGTHHQLLTTSPLYRTLHDLSAGTGART